MNLGHLLNGDLQHTILLTLAAFGLTDDSELLKINIKPKDCSKLKNYIYLIQNLND